MELSLDWILAISGALALALVCKLVSKSLNKKVDTMFNDMPDTRTQRFFFAFDGQPKPITVTEASKLIEKNNGALEIEGLYNERPVKVTVRTRGLSGSTVENSVAGHNYSMDCKTKFDLIVQRENQESDSEIDKSLHQMNKLEETLEGLSIHTDNLENASKFLGQSEVSEYIAHLVNSSKVSKIIVSNNQIVLSDDEAQGGESFIRIKAIFEMQSHLAKSLELASV